ncbi:MAG: 4-(cytidine 5'-diphospho)-2-C-methyl-D-erythritol kinase [Burkholderiales bacterium]|nr:4-(cytidine 5'-diphospho)-2-C-methyl-D-erythritol kinase [Burkholderiales bacterium]MDE1928284.1 4-(cytidine 5'-diphospho)-2-C-methyl-D-erythritol kinase [Burkholderiales bacterium]MDE2159156.1 4-(cytidine 5'-diphospho)-2-C-methyl-D-erythritol kinase [Burkholderiales bacterium]MDE2501458.1 4-(cytidine 5'-diphospho)-2-C-methyl-D-erythritol kinase [Burkholderiales bacterium]
MRALWDLPAPAKLNLFLHVLGRRADGYHLLQSPFVLLDWADRLHFERRDDGAIARHDLGAALPADDLCLRAARLLQAASGTALGVDISIAKVLPWGAGLGGGSSDAATTLLALNRLWRLHWPRARLAALALQLGADVPFFVGGRHAFVEGIGERLTPLRLPPAAYAVVKPPAALATREIFEHPALVRDHVPAILEGSLGNAADGCDCPAAWLEGFGSNDLQAPAEDRCPEVAQAARWLESRYGNSRMTGSGSAVFARVGTVDSPLSAFPADQLPPAWVGRLCRSLVEHPLRGWAD